MLKVYRKKIQKKKKNKLLPIEKFNGGYQVMDQMGKAQKNEYEDLNSIDNNLNYEEILKDNLPK